MVTEHLAASGKLARDLRAGGALDMRNAGPTGMWTRPGAGQSTPNYGLIAGQEEFVNLGW